MSAMNQPLNAGSWRPWTPAALLLLVAGALLPANAQQPADSVSAPPGERALGTIELPRSVLANGQVLPPGTYRVHLTSEAAGPEATGASAELERWVEFRQEDAVSGRELASLVPESEIGDVADSAPPANGSSRVEVLRGNDYVRVWINRDGTHYLIHLAVG